MEELLSFLVCMILYTLQIYATQRKHWIIAFFLPISVIALKLINHFFIPSYDIPFISHGTYPSFFLGAGVTSLILAFKKNKQDNVLLESTYQKQNEGK